TDAERDAVRPRSCPHRNCFGHNHRARARRCRHRGAAYLSNRPTCRPGRSALMTASTPALDITDATLELGDGDSRVLALNAVSLRVMPGEFVAIVGPSGSGKSSLLAVAGALSRPDSGTIRVHNTELTTLSKGAAARFRLEN